MMFDIVKRTIDEWDPYGLLSIGAPKDEFDTEIAMITQVITEESNVDELQAVISKVFSQMFTPCDFTLDKCRDVAEKLKQNIIQGRIV